MPGELAATYYSQRASAGLIVTEATQISPMGNGYINTPGIHSPEQVRAWSRIVESDGPINHVVRTLEKNGIIIARCDLLADKLDALSEFKSYPFVVLSSRKASAARSRFDAAHELGHIVMHRRITRRDLNNTSKFSIIEEQAHRFAGAFLLPAKHFVRELWSPSLQAFREMKEEWGA